MRILLNAYKIFSNLLSFFIFVYFIIRLARSKESLLSIINKFVFYKKNRPKGKLVWINAVSIGESKSAETIINQISKTIIEKKKLKKIPDSNINIPFFHSYCFMCDFQSLSFLIEDKAFPENDVEKSKAVNIFERYLTATLLNNGFTIKTLSLLSPRIISS